MLKITAGNQANGSFQAGQGDGGRQDQGAGGAEVVLGNEGQGLAAVGAHGEEPPALGAHNGDHQVDEGHEQAAEQAGKNGVLGHRVGFFHPQVPDGVDHHDAESQAGQGVHGLVALPEAAEKGAGGVGVHGLHPLDGPHGRDQGPDHQNPQEAEEEGIENFSHPGENLAGPEGKGQHGGEKDQREDPQSHGAVRPLENGNRSHREGDRGAAGDGEAGADGQVQGAGEKDAVALPHPGAQGEQPFLPADAQGGDPQQRQAHTGDDEADDRRPDMAAGQLAQVDGEDQVTRPKEHAEEHAGHKNQLFFR